MKILAIRLKNLTSIEGTVEVDFTAEPLHSAGIFAWHCMIRLPALLLQWKM